ncbi:hypothetical protein K523DRAFT_416462 [Schizophyllum commune Tattone D]|nr:hypothetical protein K523DRAFT_416462 [Schizophyllum commune Tattone D]
MAYVAALLQGDYERAIGLIDWALLTCSAEEVASELLGATSQMNAVALALGRTPSLRRFLLAQFPETVAQYIQSIHADFVPKLAQYIHFELSDLLDDHSLTDADDLRLASGARHACTILAHGKFPEVDPEDNVDEEEEEENDAFFKVKAKGKRQKKRTKSQISVPIDPKPFQDAGYSPPRTRAQAEGLAESMLREIKYLFSDYLEILQLPGTTDAIERALAGSSSTAQVTEATDDTDTQASSTTDAAAGEGVQSGSANPSSERDLRAMIEFDVPEELGDWNIFLSTRAYQDLRKARREDQNRYKIILKKIRHLSKGHFSDDNQKRLSKTSSKVPIYEAKMTGDTRLVYQVDCVADWQNPGMERQVISLYGVFTHAQMDDRLRRIFDAIGKEVGRKGKEYQQRCIYRQRPAVSGDNVFEPATFPLAEETPARDSDEEEIQLPPEDMERVHELLTLDKYFLFSQNVLKCLMADVDVAHVFRLSGKELEIVSHVGSCYVLGRSGTGKTTTMLFKILGLERSHRLNTHIIPERPRQLFVTQSHVLVEKVEEAYNKLAKTLDVETYSKDEVKALAMKKHETAKDHLIRSDDKKDQGKSLPQRFSDLKDEHFPLFVNYDRLCQLFEGDAAKVVTDTSSADESNLTSRIMRRSGRLVTYELFLTTYWPHFSQKLTKGLDPSLVFSEIMGVIKGSEEASLLPGRCLDRQTYEGLSVRRQSTFANRRGLIYDIFLQYTKEKASRNDYDAADRTYNILRIFQEYGIQGKKIDYLYVDEVQDNLLIDALVLRYITGNPNGLFWAGDTAQTISVGSAFRFNDLKAYLHRLEEKQIRTTQGNEPRSFQLTTNYRSHGGIVDCAHSIISLIMEYWPDSIDMLARERGQVGGPKPVFLTGWSNDNVRYEQFLFTSSTGNAIEFGAKQCILVRHEEARQRLRKEVGDIGLIMTLYESKGLEFDDVLLFNFFHDSSVETSQWRVVLNAMDSEHRQEVPAPRFDENLHAGVCSELKFLYVAITRGRKNVWIVDTSDRGEPMRMLLTAREQVENCSPENAPRLAVSSSPDEWKETAVELFKLERYMQAKMCYERAGSLVEAAISHAHYLRQQAALKPSVGHKNALAERQEAFAEAANAFAECALTAETAGQKERQEAYYRAAANAYLEASDEASAARAFIKAGDFAEGAQLYRKLGNFDETMDIVRKYRSKLTETLVERLTTVSRLYYFQTKEFKKATNLFETVEDALEFLEDTPFDVEKASLLESAGRFSEAAELYLQDRPLHAVTLFLKDVDNGISLERGKRCILDGLWKELAFEATVDEVKKKPLVASYLKLSAQLIKEDPPSARTTEFRMFHALVERDTGALRELAQKFMSNQYQAAAFVCLHHIFHPHFPNIRTLKDEELGRMLKLYSYYVHRLHDMAFDTSPCETKSIRRIFGIALTENGRASFVAAGSYLHRNILRFAPADTHITEEGATISNAELTRLLCLLLRNRLHTSLLDEEQYCRRAEGFRNVCLSFTLLGKCNSLACTRLHAAASDLGVEWYNRQIMLHLFQIQILSNDIKEYADERLDYQGYWINKLYETFFPPTSRLGTIANLRNKYIQNPPKYFQIVKYWCQDLLRHRPRSQRDERILTTVLRAAHISYVFDRADAPRYLKTAPALMHFYGRGMERYLFDGQCIVPQMLLALEGEGNQFINAGISFVRQVMKAQLQINISSLCEFCEYMAGSIILARSTNGFHNVTLPKSWVIVLVNRFKSPKFKPDVSSLDKFIVAISVLLDALYNGLSTARHLLFENSDISQTNFIRSVFIARVCRILCAVGYNNSANRIEDTQVREDIRRRLAIVFSKISVRHALYDAYSRARGWHDLLRAYLQSAQDNPMDEIVTMHDASQGVINQRKDMPRRVPFRSVETIPATLGYDFFVTSNLRAEAPVFVPRAQQPALPATTADVGDNGGIDQDDIAENAPPLGDKSLDSEELEALGSRPPPTPAEVAIGRKLLKAYRRKVAERDAARAWAATVLQAAYRRLMAFRSLSGLPRTRQNFYLSCVSQAQGMAWPSRRAKLLYFGALPHALLCFDVVTSYLESLKAKIKHDFAKLDHQRLESIGDRLTDVNKALKQAKGSAAALRPRKETYSATDCVLVMKAHVSKLVALVERLPQGNRLAIELDLSLVIASVLDYEKREREKIEAMLKQEKPLLNVAEEDDYLDY